MIAIPIASQWILLIRQMTLILDASGLYVIPGLVDIHIHGAMGCDFSDGSAEGLFKIAKYLRSCGVTAFCPTSMTLPENQLLTAFASTREIPDDNSHAFIAGIHMEGPFLSPEKKGAQKASYLRAPDIDMFRRLSLACDNKIRIITIAPELQARIFYPGISFPADHPRSFHGIL